MADVTHSIFIDAPPSRVYRAITRPNEIARWWRGDVELTMQKATPAKAVNWHCVVRRDVSSPDEAVLEFILLSKRGGTQLLVNHCATTGSATEDLASGQWTHYLNRLKSMAERGFADYECGYRAFQ